ncbi:hypothetical protein HDV05_008777 [Chytridiales sp. JEL 0842]|nr:hypothetical protein HDV05_008777 [Chytridiales sp. JEL 0842]
MTTPTSSILLLRCRLTPPPLIIIFSLLPKPLQRSYTLPTAPNPKSDNPWSASLRNQIKKTKHLQGDVYTQISDRASLPTEGLTNLEPPGVRLPVHEQNVDDAGSWREAAGEGVGKVEVLEEEFEEGLEVVEGGMKEVQSGLEGLLKKGDVLRGFGEATEGVGKIASGVGKAGVGWAKATAKGVRDSGGSMVRDAVGRVEELMGKDDEAESMTATEHAERLRIVNETMAARKEELEKKGGREPEGQDKEQEILQREAAANESMHGNKREGGYEFYDKSSEGVELSERGR